jgi:hypothetical protein
MTQANDSILVTPGSGATVATHAANGKEHQVVMVADSSGHIQGSLESWMLWVPPSAAAASKRWFDLFNAVGSGKVLDVRGIWAVPSYTAVITGTYPIPLEFYRTTAVGSGGTAATSTNTNPAAPGFTPMDTANVALPAQVTARAIPTATPTLGHLLWKAWIPTEETNAAAGLSQFMNLVPQGPMRQPLVLREGQGLYVQEDATATPVGSFAFLVQFTVE